MRCAPAGRDQRLVLIPARYWRRWSLLKPDPQRTTLAEPPPTANKVLRQGFWVYEFASGGSAYNNLGVVGKSVAAAFAFTVGQKLDAATTHYDGSTTARGWVFVFWVWGDGVTRPFKVL